MISVRFTFTFWWIVHSSFILCPHLFPPLSQYIHLLVILSLQEISCSHAFSNLQTLQFCARSLRIRLIVDPDGSSNCPLNRNGFMSMRYHMPFCNILVACNYSYQVISLRLHVRSDSANLFLQLNIAVENGIFSLRYWWNITICYLPLKLPPP